MVSKKETKMPPATTLPAPTETPEPSRSGFHIVGLGASAGGLEAFERFFQSTAPDSGMAFVVVSHLDPSHPSTLTEILQRNTAMPVVEAQDQMTVAPNNVYVIPPNRNMAIFHGSLQLSIPELPRGRRMPIDAFLRSLAEDQGENAVAIILSGTGTDGTLGARAIVGAGGLSLVQEPATAKYDGMPTSVIQAGYATHVVAVDAMPKVLLASAHRLAAGSPPSGATATLSATHSSLNRILMQLRSSSGHDFSLYKKSTIGRRVERRMALHDIEDMDVYVRYLKEHPAEVQALFKELLINVTSFFRDSEAFKLLRNDILPQLLIDRPEADTFRVWVAGCASGEEAYSVAMLLRELMDEATQEFKVQLYATDLDDDAIAVARAGVYPLNIAQDVGPERLRRFFMKDAAGFRVKKEIREMMVFAVQNIIKDPPFTKLDLLCCRNVLIYLDPELQKRLIPAFHFALKPGGVLFLSPSESIGNHTELFTALSHKWKLYRAIPSAASARAVLSGGLAWSEAKEDRAVGERMTKVREPNFAELARRALLQSYAPASVVTDLKGNILYVHGETGQYLRPAPGHASLNVIDMAHAGLQLELRAALQRAANKGQSTLNHEISDSENGKTKRIGLSVRPLSNPDVGEVLLLVSFQDITEEISEGTPSSKAVRRKPANKSNEFREGQRLEELELELAYTKDNLQATIEEQQASNEELKSTNEEMQSTNEELQSTNEELETSKEELQSVNEELVTVNAELQAKIEQLATAQNDMKNLFDNINIGTVFLDEQLCIRRFTRELTRIYPLVAADIGRSLRDIRSNLRDENLISEAEAVLNTLAPWERELCTVSGEWYLVRIQPYRTLENVIEGVVLTFTDISRRVAAEAAARVAAVMALAEGIVDTLLEPLIVLDSALRVVFASRAFYRYFQVAPEDTTGRLLYELGNRQWDIPALRELLEDILPRDQSFDGYVMEHNFPGIGLSRIVLNARRLAGKAGEPPLILLALGLDMEPAA